MKSFTSFKSIILTCQLAVFSLIAPVNAEPDHAFDILRSYYATDAHLPIAVDIKSDESAGNVRRVEFTFAAYDNQIVPARLDIPTTVEKPPVVIALHGLTQSRLQWWRTDGGPYSFPSKHRQDLIDAGIAVLAIDARAHGERLAPTDFQDQAIILQNGYFDAARKMIAETVIDVRRSIDALETIEGVDHERVGVIGYSLGAFVGHISAAVEPRIDAGFLIALPFLQVSEGQSASFTSPFNYIEGLDGKQMGYLAATKDFLYTREIVEEFTAAFSQEPEVIWVETEHDMPPETSVYSTGFFLKAL